jgi:molecular chaperone DnaJ
VQRDPYQVLGLERAATAEQIKKAFRRAAREHHPDLHPDDPEAEARFQELSEAYELLSDPERRSSYDAAGSGFEPLSGADPATLGFDQVFGGIFGAPTPSRPTRPRPTRIFSPQATPDPNFADLEQALGGERPEISARIPAAVAADGGLVRIPLPGGDRVSVRIPAGTRDGARIRLAGKGPGGGAMIVRIVLA